jgi:Dolichyl-phosphate-mannose-protein mannosyltransferase
MRFSIKAWLCSEQDGFPAWRRLLWVLVLSGLAAGVGFAAFSARQSGILIKHGGYYALAGIFGWWCWAMADLVRTTAPGRLDWWRARMNRETVQVLVLIAAVTLIAVFTVPRRYKILFDEVVIQSTAWSLHMEREVGSVNRAFEVDGLMRSFETYLDKRPYFFPFLVSLLHDFTGYREANAFLLNLGLMPVILGLTYAIARKLGGHGAALAAVAGLGAFSLLAINAQGAGLEMLNLALILGLMLAGLLYLEKPDERRLTVVVLTAVLLANTRYEAGIYVGCAALLVLAGWRRAGRLVLPPAAIFGSVLLVPYALHNTYLSGTPILWELRVGMTHRFSMEYLVTNLTFARTFFFNLNGIISNSIWLTMAGLAALSLLGIWAWKRKPQWDEWTPAAASVTLCATGIVGNLCLLMAYYWGDLSDPVVSRLSLPFHALLALLLAAAIGRLPLGGRARAGRWAVGLALATYLAFGVRVNQQLDSQNTMEMAQRWEVDVLKRRGPATRLLITDKSPLSWFVRDVAAIMPGRLIMKPDALPFHWRHHTFDEVLITQTLEPAGDGRFWLTPEHRMPANYVLEVIAERRIASKLHRICLLKEIKVDVPPLDKVSSVP